MNYYGKREMLYPSCKTEFQADKKHWLPGLAILKIVAATIMSELKVGKKQDGNQNNVISKSCI